MFLSFCIPILSPPLELKMSSWFSVSNRWVFRCFPETRVITRYESPSDEGSDEWQSDVTSQPSTRPGSPASYLTIQVVRELRHLLCLERWCALVNDVLCQREQVPACPALRYIDPSAAFIRRTLSEVDWTIGGYVLGNLLWACTYPTRTANRRLSYIIDVLHCLKGGPISPHGVRSPRTQSA